MTEMSLIEFEKLQKRVHNLEIVVSVCLAALTELKSNTVYGWDTEALEESFYDIRVSLGADAGNGDMQR